jgi:YidC/Oxa1 family membrane protein insertase
MDHGMTSFHLMLRENALDHFDTVFAYGPNHIEEIRQAEELANLPAKRLVPTGYGLLDDLLEAVAADPEAAKTGSGPPVALIGPSWQLGNIMEFCLEETVRPLLEAGFKVVVRPHPEFTRRFPEKIAAFGALFAEELEAGNLVLETDFASNTTVYSADLVVTDWSSLAQEFSYATGKPSIFINTPMKVMNPNWRALKAPPLDITLRDMIGESVDVADLGSLGEVATAMVADRDQWRQRIDGVMRDNIYFIGESDQAMGEYLVEAVERFARARRGRGAVESEPEDGRAAEGSEEPKEVQAGQGG